MRIFEKTRVFTPSRSLVGVKIFDLPTEVVLRLRTVSKIYVSPVYPSKSLQARRSLMGDYFESLSGRRGFCGAARDSSARVTRRATRGQFVFARSHSHIRTTRQPALRRVRVTKESRSRFRVSFAARHPVRFFGNGACFGFGQSRQKQPSPKYGGALARKGNCYTPAGSHIGRVATAGRSQPAACKSAISSRTNSRRA